MVLLCMWWGGLLGIGKRVGGARRGGRHGEDCWPGTNLLCQWVGSAERADVQGGQASGRGWVGLLCPGTAGPQARSAEDDAAERANAGLAGGDPTTDKAEGNGGGGGYVLWLFDINHGHGGQSRPDLCAPLEFLP